jgi:RNA polymerase sigma-70 factor (ECF subfamily)
LVKIDQSNSLTGDNTAPSNGELTPEMLVRNHGPAVRAVCLAHSRNVHDAEDLMQDVFTKALTKINSLRDTTRARPWLMQIARRTCIDHYRKKNPEQPLYEDIPSREINVDQRWASLHQAIGRLPDDYRETICLYYLDGRKSAHVAQTLGISASAVRQRLVRARLMLHDLLVEDEK